MLLATCLGLPPVSLSFWVAAPAISVGNKFIGDIFLDKHTSGSVKPIFNCVWVVSR